MEITDLDSFNKYAYGHANGLNGYEDSPCIKALCVECCIDAEILLTTTKQIELIKSTTGAPIYYDVQGRAWAIIEGLCPNSTPNGCSIHEHEDYPEGCKTHIVPGDKICQYNIENTNPRTRITLATNIILLDEIL